MGIAQRELALCAKNQLTFLPQMGSEDLDQTDLEGRNLAVHEDTSQVKLYLETDVDVRSIDRRAPPQRETTVRNLVETRTLRVGELLVSHRLFETGRLLPEKTLPRREIRSLEQRVLQDTFHTTQRSDDVDTIVVELPQFTVMTLRRPPEWVTVIDFGQTGTKQIR